MFMKLFVSVLFLLVAVQDAVAAKRVALVIANGDYAYLPNLDKVLNDARSLREVLTADLDFEVIYGENLNRRDMNRKILEMESRIERGDTVFIYYGGHGVSLGTENHILPVDLQQPEPGEEKLVMGDSFGIGSIARNVQAKGASATIIVLDACRNNPFKGRAIGLEAGLSKMDLPEGSFVLYSAAHGRPSQNTLSGSDQDPNSVFVRNLLPVLKTPYLTQIDLAKKVQEKVSAAAATTGHEQVPAYQDRLLAPVTLNEKPGDNAAKDNAPESKTPESKAPLDQAAVIEEWKIVKDSGNRAVLEGFKAKYGSDPVWGPLVTQALLNLDKKPGNPTATPDTPEGEDFENKPLYRDLQAELKRIGCYSGNVDGVWGPTSQRALARFAQRENQTLDADEDALEELSEAESGTCRETVAREPTKSVAREPRKTVDTAKPKKSASVVRPRKPERAVRRVVRSRPSQTCWVCHTYSYDSERVCLPARIGNPEIKVPPYIRCRRG